MLTFSKGVTLSGRLSSGHVEPTYSDMIDLSKSEAPSGPSNIHQGGMYYVSGVCKNCTDNAKNAIDLDDTSQPFIWALGTPYKYPASMSESGPLYVHSYYGFFTVDMPKVMGGNNVPVLGTMMENVGENGESGAIKYTDFGDGGHGFVMILAFLILFPLGVFSVRVLENIKLHLWFQTIGFAFVLIGAILGFYISTIYNRSKDWNSPHQIIGILLVVLLIGQWLGGLIHHKYYIRNERPLLNGFPIKGHKMILGPIILVAGLVNAAIGFNFALSHTYDYVYIPLVGAMLVLFIVSIFLKPVILRRIYKGRAPAAARGKQNPIISPPQPIQPFGQQRPVPLGRYDSSRSTIPLTQMPGIDPPSYDDAPVKPRDMI
jgi:hypothetical protein